VTLAGWRVAPAEAVCDCSVDGAGLLQFRQLRVWWGSAIASTRTHARTHARKQAIHDNELIVSTLHHPILFFLPDGKACAQVR
jgi:hypothetical protein